MSSNCPNCNGLLSYDGGLHCDYCGARFEKPSVSVRVDVRCDVDAALVARGLVSPNEARSRMPVAPTTNSR